MHKTLRNYKPESNPWVFFLSESTICDLHLRLCFSLTTLTSNTVRINMVTQSCLELHVQGIWSTLPAYAGTKMHTVHKHTCKLKTHTHKIKINKSWKWGCGKAILVMCCCPLILKLCLCWELLRVSIQFLLLLYYLKMSVIRCFWSLVVSQEHTNNTHKIPITQMDFCVSFTKKIFPLT